LLKEIYNKAGLDSTEIRRMPSYIEGELEDDFFYSTAYNKLYEYLAFVTAEMPYGIAKARDGDPDVWILEYLEELRGIYETR